MNNDFIEALAEFLNALGLPLQARLDYLSEHEDLVIYSLPGGQVISEDMSGTQTVRLPFEIVVKSKDQQKANTILWAINYALSAMTVQIDSLNGSYEFLNLDVSKPFINDKDEQGFYIYMLDITATIEIERN
ncbi:minor capsid protein [Enterococcus cecorum]|uniref:minor capsid protein n=1 Tax=Enterococcus cecorum TaxID=44008 RepID=UPI002ACA5FD3|nr:minor capsid protein [Enterococcus cecorum]MDZ5503169.1 minor capsid protein [Enterococcus cecorum]MDZ5557022.1 minor capsid protein [Enterococcus cecorum]MDZ5559091.1 minor capsid protein [Enterococcus cecorum]MDZ5592033.1 minor capsid protein [Enterococcus cecorum]